MWMAKSGDIQNKINLIICVIPSSNTITVAVLKLKNSNGKLQLKSTGLT